MFQTLILHAYIINYFPTFESLAIAWNINFNVHLYI